MIRSAQHGRGELHFQELTGRWAALMSTKKEEQVNEQVLC
jgi:hypothetical protein